MLRTRRQFIVNGIQVSSAVPLLQLANRATGGAGDERILVIVQLSGGNDGLNMLVPHRQDAYYRRRPTLSLRPQALHALDDDFGLHPSMGALAEVYREGSLGVIHSVGYPRPNRSHFRSMDIWHTADPIDESRDLGWLGRMADQMQTLDPERLVALHVGSGELPLALYGRDAFAPTARDKQSFQLNASGELERAREALLQSPKTSSANLEFLRSAARSTYRAAERMQSLGKQSSRVDYPGLNLATELKLVSQLISSDFGPRIFHLEMTGFDTHVRQARSHAELLNELSASLAAFQHDLHASGHAGRVLTFVFSEFGRRVAENQSGGTDHGAAGPCFLMGEKVRAGLHGSGPDLAHLVEGDISYSSDFRSIYSTLEGEWMRLATSSELGGMNLLI